MTTSSTCDSCHAPIPDGHLCARCTREIRDALTDLAPGTTQLPSYARGRAGRAATTRWDLPTAVMVGGLADHLDTTAARLHRLSPPAGAAGGEKPPPFHEKAAALRAHLRGALAPWARHALDLERPTPHPPACRHRDPVGVDCHAADPKFCCGGCLHLAADWDGYRRPEQQPRAEHRWDCPTCGAYTVHRCGDRDPIAAFEQGYAQGARDAIPDPPRPQPHEETQQ